MQYLEISAGITHTLLSWSDTFTLIMLVDEILALRSSRGKLYALYIPIVESSLTFHIAAETVECTFSQRWCILQAGQLRWSHKRLVQEIT